MQYDSEIIQLQLFCLDFNININIIALIHQVDIDLVQINRSFRDYFHRNGNLLPITIGNGFMSSFDLLNCLLVDIKLLSFLVDFIGFMK